MSDLREKIDLLADLMEEYGLEEAKLEGKDWSVSFSSAAPQPHYAPAPAAGIAQPAEPKAKKKAKAAVAPIQQGTPVSSPMMGIFYTSSSPSTPPFVKVGERVNAGQVVGLVEAMKVFNEVTAPVSGTVLNIHVENAQLVQPGTVLVSIG